MPLSLVAGKLFSFSDALFSWFFILLVAMRLCFCIWSSQDPLNWLCVFSGSYSLLGRLLETFSFSFSFLNFQRGELYHKFVDSPWPTKCGLRSEHAPRLLKLAFLDIPWSTHTAGRFGKSMHLTLGELGVPMDLVGRRGSSCHSQRLVGGLSAKQIQDRLKFLSTSFPKSSRSSHD